ncbi:MAG: hypothetical protein RI957_1979 [Verrucomicrobiota bacterium]|jgi:hypothetical protein
MVWTLAILAVSCTRKAEEVSVHPAVVPLNTAGGNDPTAEEEIKAPDDSSDLTQQLRDPDLLNRLDDDAPKGSGSATVKPTGAPIIIKGVDVPPDPIGSPGVAPSPPIGKPTIPTGSDEKRSPSTGTDS